jgi:hypothetical protein
MRQLDRTPPRRRGRRRPGTLRTAILAVVGLGLAVVVGLAANAISRDSIGLAPTPAGSGVRLAPARSTPTVAAPARKAPSTKATKPKGATGTTTATPAPTTTSGGDDNGGNRGRGGGSGSGSSGGSGKGRGGGDD